jgi:Zn-dependent peptidase ImmA (M78 family)
MPELRIAPPLTREEIEDIAWETRDALGLLAFERVPVAKVLEHVLPELINGYEFRVEESRTLGGAEAVTDATRPVITFNASSYDRLARDHPRARMTGAHELGHLLLHTGRTGYAFLRCRDDRLDPERQADIFAEALLMPECAFKQVRSIKEAMERFGVSKDAACYRARKLKMMHLLGYGRSRSSPKKKGYSKRRTP